MFRVALLRERLSFVVSAVKMVSKIYESCASKWLLKFTSIVLQNVVYYFCKLTEMIGNHVRIPRYKQDINKN